MKTLANKNPQEEAIFAKAFALATELQSKGKKTEAQKIYEELLSLSPGHAGAMHNYGLMLLEDGAHERALALLKNSAALQPKNAKAWNSLGSAQRKLEMFADAVESFGKAIDIDPEYANAWFNRANSCWELERFADAAESYKKAYDLDKNMPEIDAYLAAMAFQTGDLEEGVLHYRRALEKDPDNSEAAYHLAQNKTFTGAEDPDFKALERLNASAKQKAHSKEWLSYLNFALAKAYRDFGDDEKSFERLDYANSLKRQSWNISADRFEDIYSEMGKLIALSGKENLEKLKDAAMDADTPVFIVGMPRSGTTLTEQILASHPDVFGAGELKAFGNAVMKNLGNPADGAKLLPYEEIARGLTSQTLRRIGEEYLKRINGISTGKKHVTDKMPFNFFWIGLIKTVFPKAKIIHCRRDPVDVCLSIYQRIFFDDIHWGYNQTELGRYYKHYERIMAHWENLFPGEIHHQKYEDMVSDQEGQTRKLLEFCGLGWDDRCLKFYEHKRVVRTASMQQVRKPIYRDSAKRWKKYEKHIAPLLDALDIR